MRMLKYAFPTLFAIGFFFTSALAATPVGFDDCLSSAMDNNGDVVKAAKAVEIASAKKREGRTSFYPVLSAGGLFTHLNEPPPVVDLSSLGRPGATPPSISGNPLLQYANQDTYTAFIRVNQPVYTGGRNSALLRSYESEYRIRQAELRSARSKLSVEMTSAFYGVILADEMRKLSTEIARQFDNHLRVVEKFMNQGTATKFDYLKTESQLISWQPRVVSAERNYNNALRRLKLLMGVPLESDIVPGGQAFPVEDTQKISLEEARKKAQADRPELVMAREARAISERMKAVKYSVALPQVNLQYNYNFYDKAGSLTLESSSWQTWWDLRAALSWDVFSFGRYRSQARQSALEAEQRSVDVDLLSKNIAIEVEDAFERREESRAAVAAWQKNLEVVEEAYKIANANYRSGTMTNVDVLDSYVALADARTQYLKALYEYRVAVAGFKRAIALDK